ncbi:MAG: AtpZ/AtpI family protein [Vulcanimicrobiota bacterium]
MTEKQQSSGKSGRIYGRQVGLQEKRKLRAKDQDSSTNWSGVAVSGLIGWAVVTPTLLGAAFGRWIDRSYPGPRSWTLVFLVAGLVLGCWNAWHWVRKQEAGLGHHLPEDPHVE